MHGQHLLERMREWYNTFLLPFAIKNADLAVTEINIDQLDINQFTDPNGCIQKCLNVHHVLKILRLPDNIIISF